MALIDLSGLGHFKDKENEMIAADYSATKTYAVGDYVYYNGVLKRCTTAITTAEAYTAAHWTNAVLAGDVSGLKTALTYINDATEITITEFENTLSVNGATAVYENGKVKLYGTISGTRYLACLNGNAEVKTSSSPFTKTIGSGNYVVHIKVTGYAASNYDARLSYTATKFSSPTSVYDNQTIVTSNDLMVALRCAPNTNFGTSENPTYFEISLTPYEGKASRETVDALIKVTDGNKYENLQRVAIQYGVSSLTTINGKLYAFPYTESDGGQIYELAEDGTIPTNYSTFTTNIGHMNSADYNANNGYLLVVNGDEEDHNIYLFPNASAKTSFDKTASDTLTIDLSGIENIGSKFDGACWGQDNSRKYDMLYLLTRENSLNTAYISLIQLGKGSNDLGSGTGISGATETEFNGTYQVINTLSRTLTTYNGIVDNNNDCCYYEGKIYEIPAPSSPSGLAIMIHEFINFDTEIETKRIFIPIRSATGETIPQEKEGIAILNHNLYVGTHSSGYWRYRI